MSLYYKIWVDAIASQKEKKSATANWKYSTLLAMSALQGINLFAFFYWMKMLVNRNLPLFFTTYIFNARPLNSFISIMLTLYLPFVILNYLLIFNNDRYETLLTKYPSQNGKLYKKYALISIGILAVPVIIVMMFFKS